MIEKDERKRSETMDKEHIYFENYADTWDRDRKENPEKLQFLLNLARIRAGASVLDAGCGTGVLLPYISRVVGEGGTVTGLDYSRQMLDKARKKFSDLPGLSLVEGDVLKYDLPEQAYDVVVCLNFYPHISSRSKDFVKKMRRALKDGGSLIVMHDGTAAGKPHSRRPRRPPAAASCRYAGGRSCRRGIYPFSCRRLG